MLNGALCRGSAAGRVCLSCFSKEWGGRDVIFLFLQLAKWAIDTYCCTDGGEPNFLSAGEEMLNVKQQCCCCTQCKKKMSLRVPVVCVGCARRLMVLQYQL